MLRAETKHPLDPLSAAEISIAVATVRAAGATPEVHNGFIFRFLLPYCFNMPSQVSVSSLSS